MKAICGYLEVSCLKVCVLAAIHRDFEDTRPRKVELPIYSSFCCSLAFSWSRLSFTTSIDIARVMALGNY